MEIKSTSDFLARCFNNPLMRNSDHAVLYRGVNKIFPRETRHIPSINYSPANFYEQEELIFKETLSIFPDEMLAQKSTVEKLIIMQHYGFPTRIMDVSKNPLISLFFACFADKGGEKTLEEDGTIYVYAVGKKEIKFCDSDSVAIIANLCKRPNTFNIKKYMRMQRDEFNKQEEVQYLVYEIREEKPHFHPFVIPQTINSVICLRPRMNNQRIIRQDGYFFIFGIDGEKKHPAKLPEKWIQEMFVIPSKNKKTILKELDAMGINEGFVYPDFQHISDVLRKRYAKK